MEQEIKDIIAKNLPEQVGAVLREKLERADNDAHDNKILRHRLDEKTDEVKTLYQEISELKKQIVHKNYLQELEETLKKKEMAMELEIANIRLEEAIKRSEATYRLTEHIFRSPITRRSIENMQVGGYNSAGTYTTVGAVPTHIVETIE
jgi:uncharacterized protein YigA (DUF484 family)